MNRDPMENETPTRMMTLDEQRLLTAFIQTSHDAIIGKDRNGIITSWSPGAERVFGYTAKEVIGKAITILFPPDRLDEERAIEQEVFVKGGHVKHYETVRRRKDGSLVDVSLTISPVRNEQGGIIGASKFAHGARTA
ncbi:MAG TPA: PAS domain S-box protein [Flavobacteriales bacterium]|nr:PAS domain S-box protein [Flavobacteriales bacterium]